MYICELLECIQNTSGISPPDAPASRSVQYESHSLTCTSTLIPVSSVKRSHICCRPFCWLLSQITTSSASLLLPPLLPSPPPHAHSENAVAAASPTATAFFIVLLIKPSSFYIPGRIYDTHILFHILNSASCSAGSPYGVLCAFYD